MDNFKEQIAEILDVDVEDIDMSKKFEDYDSWDSLAALSLISLADTDYDKSVNRAKILEFPSINDFYNFLKS